MISSIKLIKINSISAKTEMKTEANLIYRIKKCISLNCNTYTLQTR